MALRIVHSTPLPGARNMAVDDVLLDSVRAGAGPILRTYRWQPPAVSLGYAQVADEAVDVALCRERGIDVVRRPTGGRAVLHWNELTYSFHCADGEGPAAHSVHEASRLLGECLADGLRRFGVDARMERGASPAAGRRGACFASTSRWELTSGGRKLVGSAQRRTRGALLQHGSILAGPEHLQLTDLLPAPVPADRDLADASTHLGEQLDGPADLSLLATYLAAAFAEGLQLAAEERPLTPAEEAEAGERMRTTYGNDDFTFRVRRRAVPTS